MSKTKKVVRRGKPDFTPVTPPQSSSSIAGDLLSEIKKDAPPLVEIDISEFCNIPEGQRRFLTWQCPSVAKFYAISKDGEKLAMENPTWEKQLAYDAATFAACHVGPSTNLPVGRFYAAIGKMENPALWFYIGNRLAEVFPHLSGNSPTTYDKTLDAVTELMNKHPDQCGDLSSEAVNGLNEAHDRKLARGI